jgi:MGT family glycosyltransferase
MGLDVTRPAGLSGEALTQWALRAVFVEVLATKLAPDLREVVETWRPDVIVRDDSEYAACVVGEALDVPVVTVTFGQLPDRRHLAEHAGDALQALRRSQGLPPDASLASIHRGPVLVPAPPSYVDPALPVPSQVSFVQPMVHDTAGGERLPAWISDLGELPVVSVTLGNVVNREQRFRPFLDALVDEPIDLVVTVGRAVDPAAFGSLPANVHVERYIPQSLLFEHVDGVVCHGGFNTVIGALRRGLPLVVTPITADQPAHARSCAGVGAGRVVGWPADPDEIRIATRAILHDRTYRDAARRVQHEIAALPDLAATADIVERAG